MSLEFLALLRDVDPQAPMATYAGGALDCEANGDRVLGLWSNIDVLAGDIRRAVVVQRKLVYLVGHHCFRYHDDKRKSSLAGSWAVGVAIDFWGNHVPCRCTCKEGHPDHGGTLGTSGRCSRLQKAAGGPTQNCGGGARRWRIDDCKTGGVRSRPSNKNLSIRGK